MFNIEEELKKLPQKPGVYLMKDENDAIIYVGKAINLKSRVRSYFRDSSQSNLKVSSMVKNIIEFEYIVTNSEVEALILECNLIKEYKPKYNILLKDGKGYPYIKLTTEKYPRIFISHKLVKDKNKYFGPYTSRLAVKETLELIHDIWKIRECHKVFPRDFNKERPCLNYHIGKCLAPCTGKVSETTYKDMITEAISLLNGKYTEVINKLEKNMLELSENLDFEKAAEIRDQINAIKVLNEKQNIDLDTQDDHDIIAMARADNETVMQMFFIRNGKMIGREHFLLDNTSKLTREEVMTAFIKQFYNDTSFVPKEILTEVEIEDKEVIEKWLSILRGSNVIVNNPKKGDKLRLVELAHKNASIMLVQFSEKLKQEKEKTIGALDEIKQALDIQTNLRRIESYDISNTQGFQSVASMIVFENGKPKKSDYRKFKIKNVLGSDDYASMKEVLFRRLSRYMQQQENPNNNFSELPDIIFVDGGKGHVNAVKEVLQELSINILVAGMVKDDKHMTRALIFEGNEIKLPHNKEGFKLITRIQNEVHRFAIEYHRKLREKIMVKSILDDVKNIGDKRKKALLKHFGSIDEIKKASIEDLLCVKEIDKRSAESLYNFFR